uniref:Solute carrier family 16 member 12 n=1 Tax=Latimeria chalumnae TaxID=7897 RepID=H2ZU91_LATCH
LAPLGSFLGNHLSCRVAVILGGMLASTGLILSSFATSLEYLYLTLGVLTGLGFALSYTPTIAMVGKYFTQRKAVAYGIAMSGSGIGTFFLAPVVQLLIEHFSWRGALLILGGFVANLCVCGALLRPITLKEDLAKLKPSNCKPIKLEKNCGLKCFCCLSHQEYDFLLMPDFIVLAFSILFMAYGCSPPFVYLVPYALSVGVSHQNAAFLMSILGVIDIVGNITFGWLTDRSLSEELIFSVICYALIYRSLVHLYFASLFRFWLLCLIATLRNLRGLLEGIMLLLITYNSVLVWNTKIHSEHYL